MIVVTGENLKKVCDTLTLERCNVLAALLTKKAKEYSVETYDAFHEFLGQVVHESWQFRYKSEDLNYSAGRLAQVWPRTFSKSKSKPFLPNAMAQRYAHRPVALANFQYGTKYGNRAGTDDGWIFRGGGYIGLTFRSVWEAFAKYKKMDVLACTEWVRNTDEGALDAAFWFFYVYRNLKELAIADNDKLITVRINGGMINFADRIKYTERAEKYIN